MASDVFDPGHLFGHVQDTDHIEVSTSVVPSGKISLPQPLRMDKPLWSGKTGVVSIDNIDFRADRAQVHQVHAARNHRGVGRGRGLYSARQQDVGRRPSQGAVVEPARGHAPVHS